MKRVLGLGARGFFLVVCCLTNDAFADPVDWPSLGFNLAVTNTFTAPTTIASARDATHRLFIEEQTGRIWIIRSNSVLAQPFLDMAGRVATQGAEQGLLGLAFAPNYSAHPHFYVDYTRRPDGATVISRFSVTSDANVADTNSEQMLLVIPQPAINHNGGQLAFGPDGYLYIGMGDGGFEGDPLNIAQNPRVPLGKLLRIDVEGASSPYGIPPSNPFVENTNYAPEIWALGLRNPWRFSFDRSTGDLYIGDVGQYRYEEIDFQPAGSAGGQNYGWRIMEGATNFNMPSGFTNFAALTLPVAWYDHLSLPTDLAGSVTGGYVYRGPSEPRMDGLYLYGDFMAGWIWALKRLDTNWQSFPLLTPGNSAHFSISTFGEDDDGALYLADYFRGKIYQIQDTHQAWAPQFVPGSGFINSNLVVVTCVTPNAEIHFTTNGSDPTPADPLVISGTVISVSTGLTNKARAFRADLNPSEVARAVFTNRVGTPFFIPPPGPVTNGTRVFIATVTPSAIIYFTTNSATPTTNSLLYTGPVTITGNLILKAMGVETGYSNSVVAMGSYSLASAATPVFDPPTGPITNGTLISISCPTPGSTIYFTVDGSSPTTNSALYSAPFQINGGTTLNAFATASGYLNSSVATRYYGLVQTATPLFAPPLGPITNGTSLSITCATPGSTIFYTLDGNVPTTNSAIYSSPLVIDGGTIVSAFATAAQHLDSIVQTVGYELIQTETPVFDPSSGPITNGTPVSISCATPGAVIYFTLDGSSPTTNSAVYSNPVPLKGNTLLNAFATAVGWQDSGVNSVFYNLLPAATPVFDPPPGLLTNHSLISISTDTTNATIRYTMDGAIPDTNSPIYSAPLLFTNPMTLSARAFRNDLDPSGVQQGYYSLIDWESFVVTTVAGSSTPGLSNALGTTAQFSGPQGVSVDSAGNLYVADAGNNVIRRVMLSSGLVTTFAGTGVAGSQTGPSTNAQFSGPCDVAIDKSGNVFVADRGNNRVCKIDTNGMVGVLATLSSGGLWQMTLDPFGNIYIGSSGTVQKVLPDGTVIDLGGNMNPTCAGGWCTYVGAGVDPLTNVYAATEFKVWQIAADGSTYLYAGPAGYNGGFTDGPRLSALFQGPEALVFDARTNMFVSDQIRIRKIRPDGWVSTVAGNGGWGYRNGRGSDALFNSAYGICIDTNQNLYVADYANNCVRKISPDTAGIGIADDWQRAYFGSVGIDPYGDPDHDGMSNYAEFWAGTNPLDANSVLLIKNVAVVTNGYTQITWQSAPTRTYTVKYSEDMSSWTVLRSGVGGTGSAVSVIDSAPPSVVARRFYRVFVDF